MKIKENLLCNICLKLQAQVKVVAIFCDEDKARRAGPGENLRVRISGVEEEEVSAGFVLSSVGKFLVHYLSYSGKSSWILKM